MSIPATGTLTPEAAQAFAVAWIAAWNRRDIEAILAHYDDQAARFTSPIAAKTVGNPVIDRKNALRTYWQAALDRIDRLVFTLDRALWDPARSELVVVYTAALDDRRTRACEIMRFGPDGRIVEGEAMYGAGA